MFLLVRFYSIIMLIYGFVTRDKSLCAIFLFADDCNIWFELNKLIKILMNGREF